MECDSHLLQSISSNDESSPEMWSSGDKRKALQIECRILICQNILHYFKTRFAVKVTADNPGTVENFSLFMCTRFLGQQYH